MLSFILMRYKFLSVLLVVYSNFAMSALQLSSTRVIYNENESSITISANNKSNRPHLIQTWVESSTGDLEDAPFIIVPPVARIEGGEGQVYRIYRTEDKINGDSEKIYWVNFLDIPPRDKESDSDNVMQFAIRTRIKLFYRPEEAMAYEKYFKNDTSWKVVRNKDGGSVLTCVNRSLLNYSISGLQLGEGNTYRVGGICPAKGKTEFNIGKMEEDNTLNYLGVDVVNDFGGIDKYTVSIEEYD
ncbi:molecular chaperone [Salinivibrio kushneri]|uniref:fimbrial biogenesis chaperone n=1 Tax=Salinivibrio kushneri TaxID=1908198 RepID=UPI000986978A|nr:molecular chaperone [Salinivibrio kushneri]OOE61632.1 hypothetical protein BZG18_07440 [Salinivibrio kushneri]